MKRIQPQGEMLIVLEDRPKHFKTDSDIELVDLVTTEGIVVEIPEKYKEVYTKGDRIVFSLNAGTNVFYNGKMHLYIRGGGHPMLGDVWGIITEDK